MSNLIMIDGSSGEGGGQIIRTALACSTLTGRAFKITNIRANRPKPGLSAQHLACVKALQDWTGAKADGVEIGSKELLFIPGVAKSKTVIIDVGTAGSITLLMQALILPALFARGPVRFSIKGGTDVKWSMSWDYFANVIMPQYRTLAKIDVSLVKRGYYPMGKGEVRVRVVPKQSLAHIEELPEVLATEKPLDLVDLGQLYAIRGVSHASDDKEADEFAERQARAAHQKLSRLNIPVSITANYQKTDSPGSGITLWALYSDLPDELNQIKPIILGSDVLDGNAEDSGRAAADKLLNSMTHAQPVDSNLADNLVPLLAIRGGEFRTEEVTEHTKSNITIVNKFFDNKIKSDNHRVWRE